MRSFVAVVLLCAGSAFAQPYLVKDIRTAGPVSGSSNPTQFVTLGSSLYFATSSSAGDALWRSDGTSAGTTRVVNDSVAALTPLGSRLIYVSGQSIRATDGTAAGTKTISTTPIATDRFVESGGQLIFVNAGALWSTDGTTTKLAVDFGAGLNATLLGRFGDRVVFVSPKIGIAITDGTASGTSVLDSTVHDAGDIVVAGSHFFFAGNTNTRYPNCELWVSDGTAAGTHMTKKIAFPTLFDKTAPLGVIGERVLFAPTSIQSGSLWVTDGSEAGTVLVTKLYIDTRFMVALGGAVYFVATDTVRGLIVPVLWRSDGTAEGTKKVADVDGVFDMREAAGRLWMSVDRSAPVELWGSDGTTAGTRRLASADPSAPFVAFNGRVYFAAWDEAHANEPWSSDGTPEGTSIMANLEPDIAPSSSPAPIIATSDHLLFVASNDDGFRSFWTTDGTAAGTQPFPRVLTAPARLGDAVLFTSEGELYRTDGTAEGITFVAMLRFTASTDKVGTAGGLIYVTTDLNGDQELWASDGTSGGTRRIGDEIFSTPGIDVAGHLVYQADGFLWEIAGYGAPRAITSASSVAWIAQAGGKIFYAVGGDLYVTDGTLTGVRRIASFLKTPTVLGTVDDRLLLAADDGVNGQELWVSDGTAAGTQLVRDIRSGSASSNIAYAVQLDGRIVFSADDGVFGPRLWSSDGTAAGTRMIAPLTVTSQGSAKGVAFISGDDGLRGRELWRTDGTPEGTSLVADINGGAASSDPASMIATHDTLYFRATTPQTGAELWAMPLPGRTIAIDDARVSGDAATATMVVSLDAASGAPVTAAWTSTTGASGTLTFAPGERRKTISFALTPDTATKTNRFVTVRLRDVAGAIATKSFGTLIIETVASESADLELKIGIRRTVIVTNHGPDAAPIVILTIRDSFNGPDKPTILHLPSIAPGASASAFLPNLGNILSIVATSSVRDPNPSNNITIVESANVGATAPTLAIAPATLTAGMHAVLLVDEPGFSSVHLTSSDPSVIAVPSSVTVPAALDVVALAPGTVTITAGDALHQVTMTLVVEAVGPYRWTPAMTFTIDAVDHTFGVAQHVVATVTGYAWDANATPGGSVAFSDANRVIAVVSLDAKGTAEAMIDSLLPGAHTITATYSGDAHFFGARVTAPPLIIVPPPPVTISGTFRPLSDTAAEITIVVHGQPSAAPTGTITLRTPLETLATGVPLVYGLARVVTKPADYVIVEYSGDAIYGPVVVAFYLQPVKHRAAP